MTHPPRSEDHPDFEVLMHAADTPNTGTAHGALNVATAEPAPMADIVETIHARIDRAVLVLTVDREGRTDLSHAPYVEITQVIGILRDVAADIEDSEEPQQP